MTPRSVVVLTGTAKAFSAGADLRIAKAVIAATRAIGALAPSAAHRPAPDARLARDGAGHDRRH